MSGSERVLALAISSAIACFGCAPKGGGGGGVALKPAKVVLTPKMINGKGTLEVAPTGDRVRLALHAEALPPPASYSLWLARPGARTGEPLASLAAKDGRIDFDGTFPAAKFAGWTDVQLLHLPNGDGVNFSLVHPALVGKLPLTASPRSK